MLIKLDLKTTAFWSFFFLCASSLVYVYSQIAGAAYLSQVLLPYQSLSRPLSVIIALLFLIVTVRSLAIKNIFNYLFHLPTVQFYFILFLIARTIVFTSGLDSFILSIVSLLISLSILLICIRIRELPPDDYRRLKNNIVLMFCSSVIIFTLLVYLFSSEYAISWRDRYFFFFAHPNQAALTLSGCICFLVPILKENIFRVSSLVRYNSYLLQAFYVASLISLSFYFLILTGSRTGVLCILSAFLVYIVSLAKKPILGFLAILFIISWFILDGSFTILQANNELRALDFSSSSGRIQIWADFLKLFLQDPFFGAFSRVDRSESAYLLALGGGGLFLFLPFVLYMFKAFVNPILYSLTVFKTSSKIYRDHCSSLLMFSVLVLLANFFEGAYLLERFTVNFSFILLSFL
ncbi:O-antigen ligase family protein [Synechococcus sp. AH-224-G16]|nr:O-antigen ligase family protein [Synechococcus sp. AH-224-G16]